MLWIVVDLTFGLATEWMNDSVRFYFEYPTSKAADKSWNVG